MMAPKYMRLTQFHAILEAAVSELDTPIDRIDIAGSMACVRAGRDRFFVRCGLDSSQDAEGRPILGSDGWTATVIPPQGRFAAGILFELMRVFWRGLSLILPRR